MSRVRTGQRPGHPVQSAMSMMGDFDDASVKPRMTPERRRSPDGARCCRDDASVTSQTD